MYRAHVYRNEDLQTPVIRARTPIAQCICSALQIIVNSMRHTYVILVGRVSFGVPHAVDNVSREDETTWGGHVCNNSHVAQLLWLYLGCIWVCGVVGV